MKEDHLGYLVKSRKLDTPRLRAGRAVCGYIHGHQNATRTCSRVECNRSSAVFQLMTFQIFST